MSLKERFSANLKRARLRAGISQSELGRLTELHRTQIYLLESAKRMPRLDTLLKLVCALEIPADDLLEGMAWKPSTETYGSYEVTDPSARLRGDHFEGRVPPSLEVFAADPATDQTEVRPG